MISILKNKKTAKAILAQLKGCYPEAHCELNHKNAYELLVATILSAQSTDTQVNKVTEKLFVTFPTVQHLALGKLGTIKTIIKSLGLYNNKAKNILASAKMIVKNFFGVVPDSMEELLQLPGVGRKTANVVLGNAFKINEGIVVDTHVKRLAKILEFTKEDDPLKIEQDLISIFPREDWCLISHLLIFHGRRICTARKRACDRCAIGSYCLHNSERLKKS